MFGLLEQPASVFSDPTDPVDYFSKDRPNQHFAWNQFMIVMITTASARALRCVSPRSVRSLRKGS
jgi:hypothetical protein